MSGIGEHQLDLISEKHEIRSCLRGVVDLHFLIFLTRFGKRVKRASVVLKQVAKPRQKIDCAFFDCLLGID